MLIRPWRRAGRLARALTRRWSGRTAAQRAMAAGDWPRAIIVLERVLRGRPEDWNLRVQFAHALKENGRSGDARVQYQAAMTHLPHDVDVRRHFAAILRGEGDRAAALRVYGDILRIDPRDEEARLACVELGGRDHLPLDSLDPPVEVAGWIEALRTELKRAERSLEKLGYPICRYDLFRKCHPLPPPPLAGHDEPIDAVIDARDAAPDAVKATVDALTGCSQTIERCLIIASQALADHPFASIAHARGRAGPVVTIMEATALPRAIELTRRCVFLVAGAILDPAGVAWLVFASTRTGADIVYGDHDMMEHDWRGEKKYGLPRLFTMHDPWELAGTEDPPIAALVTGAMLVSAWPTVDASSFTSVKRLIAAAGSGAHIPRRIASRHLASRIARAAPAGELRRDRAVAREADGDVVADGRRGETPITVVIPTRDEAAMLEAFIASLLDHAARRDLVNLVVVDNRSMKVETRDLFARLARVGSQVVRMDEPFNWSRANNLGVEASGDVGLLVFANNDMMMTTPNWDEQVRGLLVRNDIGAVGARLHYPDGAYQHAGIVFGTDRRVACVHEALGLPAGDRGPAGRWRTMRRAAAVTGAFLATTRQTFDLMGGFDEGMSIGYNDIDFCLRVRAAGLPVIYAPDLALLHYESRTRGHNVTGEQIAWDDTELAVFAARWRDELAVDPSYNPQWARGGVPFDGFREPPMAEIVDWIDRQGGDRGWTARRAP